MLSEHPRRLNHKQSHNLTRYVTSLCQTRSPCPPPPCFPLFPSSGHTSLPSTLEILASISPRLLLLTHILFTHSILSPSSGFLCNLHDPGERHFLKTPSDYMGNFSHSPPVSQMLQIACIVILFTIKLFFNIINFCKCQRWLKLH